MKTSRLHEELGHMGEQACRKIAKHCNFKLTKNSFKTCEACAIAKARQENLNRKSKSMTFKEEDTVSEINKMISLDLSKIGISKNKERKDPDIKHPHWALIHDRATKRKFSYFFAAKSDMVEPVCEQLQIWKDQGRPVKRIRMDNAGENMKLEQRLQSADWKLGDIKCEYTSRNTPQQNSRVEKGFETILNRGRAMLVTVNIAENSPYLFAKEVLTRATKLDGLTVVKYKNEEKTRYEH